MIGTHEAVASVYGGAFHDGKNVALDALAADIRTVAGFAPGDLVDLVQKDDAVALHAFERHSRHLIHADQLLLFFLNQVFGGLRPAHLALASTLSEQARQNVLQIDVHFFHARSEEHTSEL